MYPWQKTIYESANDRDSRTVNVLWDPAGSRGKSTLAHYMQLQEKAIILPATNDADKLMASACNMCMDKELRDPKCVFINLPRSFDQEKLGGIFKVIEEIKDGYLYEMRFHYKHWYIDSPTVWIFMNQMPNMNGLSRDRWKIWTIDPNTDDLVKI